MRKYRFIAHIVLEAETPIAVGSGEKGLTVDNLISRDVYGLPYIPGTTIAGVIRHHIEDECSVSMKKYFQDVFGYKKDEKSNNKGHKEKYKNEGQGSFISFSSAHLIDKEGVVIEGLRDINMDDDYLKHFSKIPNRDHVKMNHKGVADTKGHGKFDEEVVFKGTRFAFEIEFEGRNKKQDGEFWNKILRLFSNPILRFGGGTRNGFGKVKVINELSKQIILDLENKNDLKSYLSIESSLNNDVTNWDKIQFDNVKTDWYHYQLKLIPDSFYSFGAGFGDIEVDSIPKTESFFEWDEKNKNPKLVDFNIGNHQFGRILIPATSVKGAIAHRVAYHYNNLKKNYIENQDNPQLNVVLDNDSLISQTQLIKNINALSELKIELKNLVKIDISNLSIEDLKILKQDVTDKNSTIISLTNSINSFDANKQIEDTKIWKEFTDEVGRKKEAKEEIIPIIGESNDAVRELFGFAMNDENKISNKKQGARGKVIFSDVYLKYSKEDEHVFNHVAIDRFTGGGMEGALYSEKAVKTKSEITLDIFVEKTAFNNNDIKKVFEKSLDDIINGMIQLGGNSAKGHGIFKGTLELKN